MVASTESHRVPVVVFDDGSLTRSGLERVARYAASADLVGGVRGRGLSRLLTDLGVPARDLAIPDAGLGTAVGMAASAGAVLVTGAPLDPDAWIGDVAESALASGCCGTVAHVPDASTTGSLRIAALTPSASSWATPMGAAFGAATHMYADTSARGLVAPADAGKLLEAPGVDRLFMTTAVPYPEPPPAPARPSPYAVGAADAILAVLTDVGLDITNRSPVTVRVRVRLGSPGDGGHDLGAVEAELPPRGSAHEPLAGRGFLAGLAPPRGVVRHWSHETETVYEGGDIRINGLDVRFLDPDGATIAVRSYGSRQGLHVGVVAGELGEALGSSLIRVADEYGRMAARRTGALTELLALLAVPREPADLAPASQPN